MWKTLQTRYHHTAVPLSTVCVALIILLGALLASSCSATDAGRLDAAKTWPLVDRLTARQAQYVDAGILPDGSAMGFATQMVQRTSLVVLRNVFLAALGRPLEPLPAPPAEVGQ